MPVIPTMAKFAEQSSKYIYGGPDIGSKPGMNPIEMVLAVSNFLLADEPGLITGIASGQADRETLLNAIIRISDEHNLGVGFQRTGFFQQVEDFLFGYGPLQSYIADENISDIDGTGPDEFTVTRKGARQVIDLSFPGEKTYDAFCRLLVIRNGGVINENDSHCRVVDSRHRLRINVTIPPRSARSTTISIRKHRLQAFSLHDLIIQGMLTGESEKIINQLAADKASILFCGKGASGKTTLLRAFIKAMPRLERVLIAESDSEIYPEKPCCLVQRIKKKNEGGRPVDLRELISDGLTLSLDTYCIGEIVGPEAYEFMRAAFSGHRCLATVHAHEAADALDRIVSLARTAAAGESELLMRKMLARGIDYIIHLDSFRVRQILKVKGLDKRGEEFAFETIWSK